MKHRLADDPFTDGEGVPRTIRGVSIASGSTRLAELAGLLGYETVWIDLEHGAATFGGLEALCVAAEAAGAWPTVRIPNNRREHVLRALEAGARIVVVPMINTEADAKEVVKHGKFPPLGRRGYNTRSRGLEYGLEGLPEAFRKANARTHLFAQIETCQAVSDLDAICRVEGLAGVLVGPGDLSQDLGKVGQFADPEVIETAVACVKQARAAGKHAGILTGPGPLLDAAIAAGSDLIFAGGDVPDLAQIWRQRLENL